MTTKTVLPPITQAEYLEAEMGYLLRHLDDGDPQNAATSVATLVNELHLLMLTLGPTANRCGRIVTENGRYYRWPVLDD